MRGAIAEGYSVSIGRGLARFEAMQPGAADRGGHGRPSVLPAGPIAFAGPAVLAATIVGTTRAQPERPRTLEPSASSPDTATTPAVLAAVQLAPVPVPAPHTRVASMVRRLYALLIAFAVSIVLYRAFGDGATFGPGGSFDGGVLDPAGVVPAVAGGAAVCAALLIASASRAGLAAIAHLRLPGLGPGARATANGLAWASLALLAVHFTADAFEPLPGGPQLFGVLLGGAFGVGTSRLHRHAIDHEAYRTFNLVAMLLAAGSLASMSITPTGDWWTRNFSTLGTSNDLAAACFNVAVVVSGAGMAGLAGPLTHALAVGGFGIRRGARTSIRVQIGLVGFGLMGVGAVPIDRVPVLHNAFALLAAAAFASLCLGTRWYAQRMPPGFVRFSYAALVVEVAAMVGYDVLHWFNLTVFEIIAFTLVFAWLIALVASTSVHRHHHRQGDAAGASRGIHEDVHPPAPERADRPRFGGVGHSPRSGRCAAAGLAVTIPAQPESRPDRTGPLPLTAERSGHVPLDRSGPSSPSSVRVARRDGLFARPRWGGR